MCDVIFININKVVNFPFICRKIPVAPVYIVYISQIVVVIMSYWSFLFCFVHFVMAMSSVYILILKVSIVIKTVK